MSSWKRINKSDRKYIVKQKRKISEWIDKIHKAYGFSITAHSLIMKKMMDDELVKNSFRIPKSKKIMTLR